MGNMDGVFLTYHNTKNILGFEYLSSNEIDYYIFGSPAISKKSFEMIMSLLQNVFDELVSRFEGKRLKIGLHCTELGKITEV
jgi:hypothetical protein